MTSSDSAPPPSKPLLSQHNVISTVALPLGSPALLPCTLRLLPFCRPIQLSVTYPLSDSPLALKPYQPSCLWMSYLWEDGGWVEERVAYEGEPEWAQPLRKEWPLGAQATDFSGWPLEHAHKLSEGGRGPSAQMPWSQWLLGQLMERHLTSQAWSGPALDGWEG